MKSPVWSSDRRIALILFTTAIFLYLPGIWWGLPHATAPDRIQAWGPDEIAPLGPMAELYSVFVHSPKINPQYPLFHYVMQALLVGPYVLWLFLTGRLSDPSVQYPFGLADPVSALVTMSLIGRSVNLMMAAGIVVIAYRTASVLWDKTTGILTSLLVLSTYPMFYYSRTSNVDMGALFWTSLGLAVFAVSMRDGLDRRRALWLGVFAALATATKDASYGPFLIVGLVLMVGPIVQQSYVPKKTTWMNGLIALLTAMAVYSLASGLLLYPARFFRHVNFIVATSNTPPTSWYSIEAGHQTYLSLMGKTTMHLVDVFGLPTFLLLIAGLLLCCLRCPKTLVFALPSLGIFLFVLLPVQFVLFRFVIIIAYVLTFFAAFGVATAIQRPSPLLRRLALAAFVIACGWSLFRAADLTHQMINDSRYEMSAWLQKNVQPGDRIGYFEARGKLPHLDGTITTTRLTSSLAQLHGDAQPEFLLIIPLQSFEPVHEWSIPDILYQALMDGSFGYKLVLDYQARSFFSHRPISYVNPPVKILARKDILERIPLQLSSSPRIPNPAPMQ